jgi:hypothetical protein
LAGATVPVFAWLNVGLTAVWLGRGADREGASEEDDLTAGRAALSSPLAALSDDQRFAKCMLEPLAQVVHPPDGRSGTDL